MRITVCGEARPISTLIMVTNMTKYVVMVRQITWYDRLAAVPGKILKWAILIQLGLLFAAGVLGVIGVPSRNGLFRTLRRLD